MPPFPLRHQRLKLSDRELPNSPGRGISDDPLFNFDAGCRFGRVPGAGLFATTPSMSLSQMTREKVRAACHLIHRRAISTRSKIRGNPLEMRKPATYLQ